MLGSLAEHRVPELRLCDGPTDSEKESLSARAIRGRGKIGAIFGGGDGT